MANQSKEHIIRYMLKLIAEKDKRVVAKTLAVFSGNISKSTIYNYLKELCDNGVIAKKEGSYELVGNKFEFQYLNDGKCGEDRIFNKDIEPLVRKSVSGSIPLGEANKKSEAVALFFSTASFLRFVSVIPALLSFALFALISIGI